MKRDLIGRMHESTAGGEVVRAFVPAPLPPIPSIDYGGGLMEQYTAATLAVGRLDGVRRLLPNKLLFLYSYVRKEAVLSSQIEGTQSSLSDLLLFEAEEAPGALFDDIVEVSSCVVGLEHGLRLLKS